MTKKDTSYVSILDFLLSGNKLQFCDSHPLNLSAVKIKMKGLDAAQVSDVVANETSWSWHFA